MLKLHVRKITIDLATQRIGRATALALACLLAPGSAVPAAFGQASGPAEVPAIEQYVEKIPASGETADGKRKGKPLSDDVRSRLKNSKNPADAQLERLTTDPRLGAPVASAAGRGDDAATSGQSDADTGAGGDTDAPGDAGSGSAGSGSAGSGSTGGGAAEGGSGSKVSLADSGSISTGGIASPLIVALILLAVTVGILAARRLAHRGNA